jgi:hypothetical protein
MATTTNYGWTTPDDTALVKDGAAAIRTLGSSVDTTTKALNPSTTLGDIEYRSSTANTNTRLPIGTSGQALTVVAGAPSWAASPTSVLTTTGDTLYASAANTLARLGIGSSGNVLTVSGGVPTWAAPSAGGMTLIAETVASANSSISFSSISGSYKQLLLVWQGIQHSTSGSDFSIRLNNDSSAIYSLTEWGINNNTATSQGLNDLTNIGDSGDNRVPFGYNSTNSTYAQAAKGQLLIDNYASTTKFKYFDATCGYGSPAAGQNAAFRFYGTYRSTSAVTSVDIVRMTGSATISNLADTSIRLYGIS